MTKVKRTEDCGNSPKSKFVEDFSIAHYTADIKFLQECVTDDVYWNIIGEKISDGKQQFIEKVNGLMNEKLIELEILHVTQHGYIGAADGRLKFGGNKWEFCNVYEFSSVKGTSMKSIRSYIIKN